MTNGVVYNKTVLENAGVNVGDIRTMDDFKDACEKIKASGVTPFFVGGKDTWTAAVLYNAMAPAFYTTEGCKYPSGEELKDGTFDWDTKGSLSLIHIYVFTDKSLALNKLHSSYIFMKTILENHKKKDLPDAWIASSDYLAIGMMRAMNELGYRVPHDFGIIGFDNLDISGYVNPRLTTVEQNQELFGEMLWLSLIHIWLQQVQI